MRMRGSFARWDADLMSLATIATPLIDQHGNQWASQLDQVHLGEPPRAYCNPNSRKACPPTCSPDNVGLSQGASQYFLRTAIGYVEGTSTLKGAWRDLTRERSLWGCSERRTSVWSPAVGAPEPSAIDAVSTRYLLPCATTRRTSDDEPPESTGKGVDSPRPCPISSAPESRAPHWRRARRGCEPRGDLIADNPIQRNKCCGLCSAWGSTHDP